MDSRLARIDAIDGWRTISVSLVIFSHVVLFSFGERGAFPWIEVWGHLGVQFFFFISGFVICRGFREERRDYGSISIVGFYLRRSFRILPPLLFFLGVTCLLGLASVIQVDFTALPYLLSFTCTLANRCGSFVTQHLWSLAVEEQFYLAFPLIFSLIAISKTNRLTVGYVAAPFIISGLALLQFTSIVSFLAEFLCMYAGVIAATHEAAIRRILGHTSPAIPIILLVVLLAVVSFLGPNRVSAVVRLFFIPTIIGAMVTSSSFGQHRVSWFLSRSAMAKFGRRSYSIYLWQQLATNPGYHPMMYLFTPAAAVALSYFSYWAVERKLIAYGAHLSGQLRGGWAKSSGDRKRTVPKNETRPLC